MNLSEINKREKDFHNELQKKDGRKFESNFYKAIRNMFEDFHNKIKENSSQNTILDFGCGIGKNLETVINFNPKEITAIDISDVSIEKAKKNAKNFSSKVIFKTGNCESTGLEDEKFDLVYGSGILHHLKLHKAILEINRLLKKEGKIIFIEPLGTNPIINLYRRLTPGSRSPDEHPFVKSDFDLIYKYFKNIKITYYGLSTLIFLPFYKSSSNSYIFKILKDLDQFLFKFYIFRIFAWSFLITAKKN
ncbi:MAG: hypothetical protein CBD76_01335 [Pelagibacteraceae bacterium TMED216]|nr:MAG: hypothetical protein CBD76_01335 [Pelagibacteraceae bacterium TMED216]|tara:strand:+ start:3597 stop:4340 length:744 start_codon:yes stop_codon:yes gene_type:complete